MTLLSKIIEKAYNQMFLFYIASNKNIFLIYGKLFINISSIFNTCWKIQLISGFFNNFT